MNIDRSRDILVGLKKREKRCEEMCNVNKIVEEVFLGHYLQTLLCFISIWTLSFLGMMGLP